MTVSPASQGSSRYCFLAFMLLLFLAGCATQTKHFTPSNLARLDNGLARIVVTREKQIAGMTTPVYIVDIGEQLASNGEILVRIGNWIKEPGLSLWYTPIMPNTFFKSPGGFMLIPDSKISFQQSDLSLEDILDKNLNAVIYVDYLTCDPARLNTLFCGDEKKQCHAEFKQELTRNDGSILNTLDSVKDQAARRNIQVTGKVEGGDTLIWDRQPGLMRIGALWGAFNKTENIIELTPGNIMVEPGKTYYLHYEISLGDKTWQGDRWTITRVE